MAYLLILARWGPYCAAGFIVVVGKGRIGSLPQRGRLDRWPAVGKWRDLAKAHLLMSSSWHQLGVAVIIIIGRGWVEKTYYKRTYFLGLAG